MDILRYAGRRLLQTVPVVFGITLIAFFMLRLIPGDPAAQMLGTRAATQENIAMVRHQLGLDQPRQYPDEQSRRSGRGPHEFMPCRD